MDAKGEGEGTLTVKSGQKKMVLNHLILCFKCLFFYIVQTFYGSDIIYTKLSKVSNKKSSIFVLSFHRIIWSFLAYAFYGGDIDAQGGRCE